MITIEVNYAGRKKPIIPEWQFTPPISGSSAIDPLTLRDLISAIVMQEAQAFGERQQKKRLVRVLTESEIEEGAREGKVEMGGREPGGAMEPERAVAIAVEAFQDGLYFIFIDGVQQKELDREVVVRPDSRVTFLRLVALAGG